MTFVATLATDSEEIHRPTWPDVEREIRALDAEERTLRILQPLPPKGAPEGCHLLAGEVAEADVSSSIRPMTTRASGAVQSFVHLCSLALSTFGPFFPGSSSRCSGV